MVQEISRRTDDYHFATRLRVRFAETDAQKVVHHANFLVYMEAARVAYFRALGWDFARIREDEELDIVIGEAACRYLAPAAFDDELEIHVKASQVKRASFRLDYLITQVKTGQPIALGTTLQVMVDGESNRPRALVPALSEAILRFEKQK
jgi:acyl-CoA thioester hydrolase